MRETMLILHFIGLSMGIGTSFAFMFIGIAASKMEKEEAQKFMLKALAITKMGHIGLGLLIVTGLYLIMPYMSNISSMPYLIVKLILVLVLAALIGLLSSLAKKAQKGDAATHLMKMQGLGRLSMLTGLAIIVMAVLSFH